MREIRREEEKMKVGEEEKMRVGEEEKMGERERRKNGQEEKIARINTVGIERKQR